MPSVTDVLPGLFPLLASFSATAPMNPNSPAPTQEWNPFYQRLFCRTEIQHDTATLLIDLESAALAIDRFIEVAHEAMHVLFWEPFFAGRWPSLDREQFVEINQLSEGQCFWYADIIVTRALRVKLSDGELVRARSAVSQPLFHPYRAFASIGIDDEGEILDHYLDAFIGEQGLLCQRRNKIFARTLFEQFSKMYLVSKDAGTTLWSQLHEIGIFDEFRRRFTAIPDLPTLLPANLLNADLRADPRSFCHAIANEGMRHIDTLSKQSILRVRQRRHIQTRAYAAYALASAARRGLVFSRAGRSPRLRSLMADVEGYMARLEGSLRQLANGARVGVVQQQCDDHDRWYSTRIRDAVARRDLWMSRRARILPRLGTRTEAFGLLDDEPAPSRDEVEAITRVALDLGHRSLSRVPSTSIARRTARLLDSLPRPKARYTDRELARWRTAVNRLLVERSILASWSVPLAAIDPEHNSFRELHFVLV